MMRMKIQQPVLTLAIILCVSGAWEVRPGFGWQLLVGDAPPAIPVAFDTFTVSALTELEAHTTDSGHSWVKVSSGAGIQIQSEDDALSYSSGDSVSSRYRLSYNPADANYSIEATYNAPSLSAGSTIGIAARLDSSADTYYMCRFLPTTQNVLISKVVSGAYTALGDSSATISAGVDYVLKFSVNGTSLKCFLDGVEKVSVTDGDITAANYAGVRAYGQPYGMLVKDLRVYE